MRVLAYSDEILGTCSVSFGCISGLGEGRCGYELERPKSVFKIRSFLGLLGYYQRFI